jgi:hypothetical protein
VAPHELSDMLGLVLGLCLGALACRAALRLRSRRRRVAAVLAVGVLLLAYARQQSLVHRQDALLASHYLHGVFRYWVDAVPLLDTPGAPHRIAVTHGVAPFLDTGFFYYLLGQELQNRLVYVPPSKSGKIVFDPTERTEEMSYDAWLRRLHQARVDHVMSIAPPTVELGWMESHPESFQPRAGERGLRGLFRVIETPPTLSDVSATATVRASGRR